MVLRLEAQGLGLLVEVDWSPGRDRTTPAGAPDWQRPGPADWSRGDWNAGAPGAQPSNGRVLRFASDRAPIEALRAAVFDYPGLLDGADVAIPAVGLAVAYILIVAKAGRVFTRVMTNDAKAALAEEGIEFRAASYVGKLPDKVLEGVTDLERRARAAITPQAFLDELKRIRE
ncbi:MAG: DUF1893 domain-containing protein [Planctomycetota bacterium]